MDSKPGRTCAAGRFQCTRRVRAQGSRVTARNRWSEYRPRRRSGCRWCRTRNATAVRRCPVRQARSACLRTSSESSSADPRREIALGADGVACPAFLLARGQIAPRFESGVRFRARVIASFTCPRMTATSSPTSVRRSNVARHRDGTTDAPGYGAEIISVSSRMPLASSGCSFGTIFRISSITAAMAYTALTPFSGLDEWQLTPSVSTTTSARPRWPI